MKMTRPAPQPACARVRQLVAVWLGCSLWWHGATSARAQVRPELERALTVTRELPGCVSAAALRARTAQYLGRAEQLAELTIEVDLEVPQFRVLREGTLLAERRFARAPAACSERRDALALAVAIAIEQVAEKSAAKSGTSQPSAASVPSGARGVRGTPIGLEPRSQNEAQGAVEAGAVDPGAREPSSLDESGSTDPRARDAASAGASNGLDERRARAGDARSGTLGPSTVSESRSLEASGRGPARAREGDARGAEPSARARDSALRRGGPVDVDARSGEPATTAGGEAGSPPSAADRAPADALALTSSGRPRARVSVIGGGVVLFEALPTAAAGLSAGAELALLPALRVGLSGLFSLPVSTSFQGGTVSAQLFGAQLTSCVNAAIFAGLLLHGCAGAVGGVIEVHGADFALNLSDRMGWLAALARARLEFPAAGRVAAGVYADARVNVLRPELQAGLASEPARTRAVGLFGAELGVELIVRLH